MEDAFYDKFEINFPDTINEDHKMIVIGSNIDSSTQRIINYLSEKGIGINANTFNYFEDDGNSYIASTYLIEPSKAEASRTKRRQVVTIWTQSLEEMTKRFQKMIPDSKIGRTGSSHKKIFTNYSSIHYEFGISGQPGKKSIYTSLRARRSLTL